MTDKKQKGKQYGWFNPLTASIHGFAHYVSVENKNLLVPVTLVTDTDTDTETKSDEDEENRNVFFGEITMFLGKHEGEILAYDEPPLCPCGWMDHRLHDDVLLDAEACTSSFCIP